MRKYFYILQCQNSEYFSTQDTVPYFLKGCSKSGEITSLSKPAPCFTGKNSRKPSMVKEMVNCKFPWGITINEKAGHLPLMFLLTIYINVKGLNHWWLVNNNQTWLFSFKHLVKCLLNINGYERNINVFLLFNIFVILNYYSWELNNFH